MSDVTEKHLEAAWAIIRQSSYLIWPAEAPELIATALATAQTEAAELRAEVERLREAMAGCQPYLKPEQTPSERMAQDQADILGLMKLLEKTKWALQDAVSTNAENCRQRDLYRHHLTKAVDMIADMNTLINDLSGTRSFAGKMVEEAARAALAQGTQPHE